MPKISTRLGPFLASACLVLAAPASADQSRAMRLAEYLPKPFAGWEMPSPVTMVLTQGETKGNYAIGTYNKSANSLTIRIFDTVMPMTRQAIDEPADFAAEPLTVKGVKGIVRAAPSGAGSASLVVDGRITVEVNWTAALKADWAGYAEAIDYAGLAAAK